MEFLQKVKVKNFARTLKKWGDNPFLPPSKYGTKHHYRQLDKYPNADQERIYTVIGSVNIQEGYSDYLGSDEGYAWVQKKSHKAYLVASTIGRRFKVLPEDLELVEEVHPQ